MNHPRAWTAEDIALLRELYPTLRAADVAERLGRTVRAIYIRAKALKLAKSADFYSSAASGRLRPGSHPNSVATRFKKGLIPANKGLRRPGWTAGRMAETQFKKGARAGRAQALYMPVGSHRIVDGVVWLKHSDHGLGDHRLDWKQVHRMVWEAANGPVPAGHIVRFRDGMKTVDPQLITLDRLELVSFAENMRRNSYHTRYPKEIGLAIQLRGALVRQINKRARSEKQD